MSMPTLIILPIILSCIFVEVVILSVIFLSLAPFLITLLSGAAESSFRRIISVSFLLSRPVVMIETSVRIILISPAVPIVIGTVGSSVIWSTFIALIFVPSCIVFHLQRLIGKDIICRCDLLEQFFVAWLTISSIWMVLLRELVEFALDLSLGRRALHAQLPIVVDFFVELAGGESATSLHPGILEEQGLN